MPNVRSYQSHLAETLKVVLNGCEVKKEWDVAKNSQDALNRQIYCPRLDLAVGPFNTDGNVAVNNERIEEAYNRHHAFVSRLNQAAQTSGFRANSNPNPRCFLAIEIENSGSRKHRLGSIMNTAALGKVGIVIGWNADVTKSLPRIHGYLGYLSEHNKLREKIRNLIIVDRSAFSGVLTGFQTAETQRPRSQN